MGGREGPYHHSGDGPGRAAGDGAALAAPAGSDRRGRHRGDGPGVVCAPQKRLLLRHRPAGRRHYAAHDQRREVVVRRRGRRGDHPAVRAGGADPPAGRDDDPHGARCRGQPLHAPSGHHRDRAGDPRAHGRRRPVRRVLRRPRSLQGVQRSLQLLRRRSGHLHRVAHPARCGRYAHSLSVQRAGPPGGVLFWQGSARAAAPGPAHDALDRHRDEPAPAVRPSGPGERARDRDEELREDPSGIGVRGRPAARRGPGRRFRRAAPRVNITCPSCETVYRVDPAKVPAGGVRARCTVCNNVFAVTAAQAAPVFTPAPAAAAPAPGPAPRPQPPPPPAAPPPVAPPARPMPRASAPPPVATPQTRPAAAPPPAARPPLAPPRPVAPRPVTRPATPPAAAPHRPLTPTAPVPPPRSPAPSPAAPAPAGGPGKRMSGPLRPVNPFMVQDPKQKARRLARALVSDLVVYHPEKRQQGIRDGTLPLLFKDEIEKSWQEYVEQVGADLAKSTPFWTEALNEILAGGGKAF